jgi:hypothetical protein
MSSPTFHPVEDSVPKVSGAIAVGENLEFQRKWWRFERFVWLVFLAVLLCDLLGLFGRGWLANAQKETPDGELRLKYERIARASTPSIMTLDFGPAAIVGGRIKVYVSDSIIKPLGAQRIAPQPELSTIGNGGITYTFAASESPASVQIELEPSFPGLHHFRIQPVGSTPIEADILVVP